MKQSRDLLGLLHTKTAWGHMLIVVLASRQQVKAKMVPDYLDCNHAALCLCAASESCWQGRRGKKPLVKGQLVPFVEHGENEQ